MMFSCLLFGQEKSLLDYDECKDEVSKSLQKKYIKAVGYFNDKKYSQASTLLQSIIKEDESFASPYFLMGMIGVVKDNTTMIMKYFPLVMEHCEEFSHPYLYYYLGMIDYTEEKYAKASENFERFLRLTDQDNRYDSLQQEAINYIDWSDFLKSTMNNQVSFSPTKISFLAKNKNYYEPFITWDESEIWFIREEIERDTNKDSFTSEVSTSIDRFLERSIFDSTGFYDKGFIMDDPFNNVKPMGGVSITADNNYVFYSVKNTSSDNDSWDIYYVERLEDDYFSNPKAINLNTSEFDEFSPSISPDGNTLYFVSNRKGSKGNFDIWVSKRKGKDTWSEPENLGRNVNTFGSETYPFIAADNRHLYFLSNGRKTWGGSDIFVYDLQSDKPAQNIGYPINTEEAEHSMGVCLDGKTAYSTFKNKDNDFLEINRFELDSKHQSEERFLVDVSMDKQLRGDITLNVVNLSNSKTDAYYIADEHPNATFIVEKSPKYLCVLDQKGYMFYVEKFSYDTKNLTIKQLPLESGMSCPLNAIDFDQSGVVFDDLSQTILDRFISFLKGSPKYRIEISSNAKMNKALKQYLVKSGIREDRLSFLDTSSDKVIYKIQ